MIRHIRLSIAATCAATLTACATTSRGGAPATASSEALGAGFSESVRRDLETLRTATAPYHDIRAAHAAGYPVVVPKCIADSTMGGMGRHVFDRASYDDTLKIERPEMLIYAARGDSIGRLVAVEYVVPFRLRPSTGVAPRLFGQEFRKHDEFQYWYLHVWAWERNPAGLFADWNPLIACPSAPR
jgi:hypothetical protein